MQHGRNRKTSSYPQQPLAQRPQLDPSSPPLVNDVQGSIDVLDKSDSFAGDVLKTFFDVENMFLTEQLRDKDDLLVEPLQRSELESMPFQLCDSSILPDSLLNDLPV